MPIRRVLRSFCARTVLVGALLAMLVTPTVRADEEATTTPVLEVVIDQVPAGTKAGPAARAVSKQLAGLDGFVRTDLARVPGNPVHLLRATLWASVAATEAASLACDGEAAHRQLASVTTPQRRQRRFFRQLRSETYREAPTGHLEVTFYRTKAGTTREQNLARFDAAEADFAKGKGIVGHSMWIAPDGLWAHVVHWESQGAFAETGKALMRTKGVGGWIRSLDFKRFKVWKGDTLR